MSRFEVKMAASVSVLSALHGRMATPAKPQAMRRYLFPDCSGPTTAQVNFRSGMSARSRPSRKKGSLMRTWVAVATRRSLHWWCHEFIRASKRSTGQAKEWACLAAQLAERDWVMGELTIAKRDFKRDLGR
jgi:hypothetical protein